jgi:hypothetical protein
MSHTDELRSSIDGRNHHEKNHDSVDSAGQFIPH